jgi:gliding motility-associated-like protein
VAQSTAVSATDTVMNFPCASPPYGNVVISATGGAGAYVFVVSGVDSTNHTGVFNHLAPGPYTYSVTDSTGCPFTGSFAVPAGYAKDSFDITADSTSCFGLSDGSVVLTAVSTPNAPYSYSLNGGPAQSGLVFDSLAGGNYQVIVYNGIGCNDTLNTVVYEPEPVSVSFSPDTVSGINHDSVTLSTPIIHNFISPVYNWYPSQGLSCTTCVDPSVALSEVSVVPPLVYYVRVSDSLNSNCYAYDSIIVLIKGAFAMPDAFSPNGDDKNDLFGPVMYSYLTIKEFHIYDRWGALVHNSPELWDGKFQGKEQPSGTYVYYIEVQYPDPINPSITDTGKRHGSVVLLR